MEIVFLGTGGAWGLPELGCTCRICREMRRLGEKRERTAMRISHADTTFLIDCGPDIRGQLQRDPVPELDGVLITHEHTDHYIGLDELFVYKRLAPRGTYRPIPLYATRESWEVIRLRFQYLVDLEVLTVREIRPGEAFSLREFEILPFKTDHGASAKGSVGYFIRGPGHGGPPVTLLYTSDFMNIPAPDPRLTGPDILIVQAFWLNEPVENRPHHMSFQRAMDFIETLVPRRQTYLVHLGDADRVPGDPANAMTKKYEARDPLRRPGTEAPYPIPLCHAEWQEAVTALAMDRGLPGEVLVARDGLNVRL